MKAAVKPSDQYDVTGVRSNEQRCPWWDATNFKKNNEIVKELIAIADEVDFTVSQLALA